MNTFIKNGTIATDNTTIQADILLEKGKIVAIGKNLSAANASTLDATNKLVLPGGIDAHTHITLNLDAAKDTDTYYEGTRAALMGGTTTIIDHLSFMPKGKTLEEHIKEYQELAKGLSCVEYLFHGLAQGVASINSKDVVCLPTLGFSSIKAYMTYDDHIDDSALLGLLRKTKALGLLLAIHAEDHSTITALRAQFVAEGKGDPIWHAKSRPVQAEALAVSRLLRLAKEAGDAPVYIVHLSSALALDAVKKAKDAGQKNIYVETCTQYLCLTDGLYTDPIKGLGAIMSPPLRTPEDIDALWQGIRDGYIHVIATDHCSFSTQDKMIGLHQFTRCPGGAPGITERLSVLYSEGVAKKRITLEQLVACVATNPAKLFGIYPQKGTLAVGSDADIVILDPTKEYTLHVDPLHGVSDYSLYEGMSIQGKIENIFLRGQEVSENSSCNLKGMGRLLTPHGNANTRTLE